MAAIPAIPDISDISGKLIKASAKYAYDPFDRIRFPERLDRGRLLFPEEWLSLYDHPVYRTLNDEQKWRLSLLETLNFFSINIHGEQQIVGGMEQRLYGKDGVASRHLASEYMQRFIHEENAHTYMLAGYCLRYGDGVAPSRSIQTRAEAEGALESDLLFFGMAMVFEMFLDFLNTTAMGDEALDEVTREVHRLHHLDETRHLAFDRTAVSTCVEELLQRGQEDAVDAVARRLTGYQDYAAAQLANPYVYEDLGLDDPYELAMTARDLPARQQKLDRWLAKGAAALDRLGLYRR